MRGKLIKFFITTEKGDGHITALLKENTNTTIKDMEEIINNVLKKEYTRAKILHYRIINDDFEIDENDL